MSTIPQTSPHAAQAFLLAIRGTFKAASQEEARTVHNLTAGNPEGVAAARALGDLSHKVYVAAKGAGDFSGVKPNELLFLDVWRDPAGIQKFFSDKQVQDGAGMMFSARDPAVFMPAIGSFSFHLPAPAGKDQRYVGIVRGPVKSHESAIAGLAEMGKAHWNDARRRGQLSHEIHFSVEPGSKELLGVDVWCDLAGMMEHYQSKAMGGLEAVFEGRPTSSIWEQAPGAWVEW